MARRICTLALLLAAGGASAAPVTITETWDYNAATVRWWNPAVRYGPPVTLPDDGQMGSRFVRLATNGTDSGNGDALITIASPALFDQTQLIRAVYKFRASGYASNHQIGVGDFYSGEPSYVGLWMDSGRGVNSIGLYRNDATVTPGAVNTIELEWDPARSVSRFKINGGAWKERVGDFAPHEGANDPYLGWPACLMFQSPWPSGTLDIGAVEITGVPLWGALDYLGFRSWQRTGASYYDGLDLGYHLGGLTGTPSGGGEFLGYNDAALSKTPSAHAWSARSPTLRKPDAGAFDLRFMAYNVGDCSTGRMRLLVRAANAANGYAVGDLIGTIPGNTDDASNMTCTAATVSGTFIMGSGQGSVGTQRVSLAAVPEGTDVYLDVRGAVESGDSSFGLQARLGGVWTDFQAATVGGVVRDRAGNAGVFRDRAGNSHLAKDRN